MVGSLLLHVQNADVVKSAILLIESAAHVPQHLDPLRKLNAVGMHGAVLCCAVLCCSCVLPLTRALFVLCCQRL